MQGKKIIHHITRGKMPDIQQVRENCLAQPAPARGFKRLRLSTAAAIVAAFLVFATAAYAVAGRVYQRVETGGNWDIVVFPDDEYGRLAYYEAWGDATRWTTFRSLLYCGFSDDLRPWRVNADGARFINEDLVGRVFTACGAPIDFELAVRSPRLRDFRRYHFDSRGYALYTAGGLPIGEITIVSNADREFTGVEIQTKAQIVHMWGYNHTLEEVLEAFGRDIRLPVTYIMDGFLPPRVRLHDRMLGSMSGGVEWEARITYSTRELRDIRDWCPQAMTIRVEVARDEDARRPWTMYYIGEVITHDIAGVTVHELNLRDTVQHFIWQHDGLVYTLFPSRVHSHAQVLEVIRSMVE